MLEIEYQELNKYTLQASQSITSYYDNMDKLNSKDKKYRFEKILAELDIVLVFTMNIRHQILQKLESMPPTVRIQMNQSLSELKTTVDTAKTLSFNFTTLLNDIREETRHQLL